MQFEEKSFKKLFRIHRKNNPGVHGRNLLLIYFSDFHSRLKSFKTIISLDVIKQYRIPCRKCVAIEMRYNSPLFYDILSILT